MILNKASGYDNIFRNIFNFLSILFLSILFFENFIFSSNFLLLGLREIDDVAFQISLNKIHVLIENGQWSQLCVLNDYAYGWIYWIFMSFITYPFYLISAYYEINLPLIVFPRQISLIFGMLSVWILQKILKEIDCSKFTISAVSFMFILLPTFGYFSLRFGTVNMLMFFSILSFYFIHKSISLKNIYFSFLSLSVAGAIKLTGIFIAPFIGLKIMQYIYINRFKNFSKNVFYPLLVFSLLLLVFTNPTLILTPFDQKYFYDYMDILKHFIEVTKQSSDNLSPLNRLYQGAFATKIQFFVNIFLFIGLISSVLITNNEKKINNILIIVTLIIVSSYLMLNVNRTVGIGYYFTSVSFLLFLGIYFFQTKLNDIVYKIIVIFIVMIMFFDIFYRIQNHYKTNLAIWHHGYYIVKEKTSKENLDIVYKLHSVLLQKLKNSNVHLFIDHTLPMSINTLSTPNAKVSYAWNNLSDTKKYYNQDVGYIILDKKAIGFLSDSQFENIIKNVDSKMKLDYLEDRNSRDKLTKEGIFDNKRYSIYYENEAFIIYIKEQNIEIK